ncbi:MAG: LapA family protein [Pseudomonadota bacterium]
MPETGAEQPAIGLETMLYKSLITTALIFMVMVFAIQNAAVVEIRLLFWQIAFPRSLLIFLMLLIGIVIGWVTRSFFLISRTPNDP